MAIITNYGIIGLYFMCCPVFKGIMKNGLGKKSKIIVVLSVVFLLVSVTGIILLGVNGANSVIGLLHYKIGIATIVLCVVHLLKRIHLLRKSLK